MTMFTMQRLIRKQFKPKLEIQSYYGYTIGFGLTSWSWTINWKKLKFAFFIAMPSDIHIQTPDWNHAKHGWWSLGFRLGRLQVLVHGSTVCNSFSKEMSTVSSFSWSSSSSSSLSSSTSSDSLINFKLFDEVAKVKNCPRTITLSKHINIYLKQAL